MDQETFQQAIDECISTLQQASQTLRANLETIKSASRDLQQKQELLEEWDSSDLKQNRNLLINFDDILSDNLDKEFEASTQKLRRLKEDFPHYRNMIENEFERLAPSRHSKIARLLESDKE